MKTKFSERLRELRLERDLKQAEIALAMLVSATTVSRWELGKDEPDFLTLVKLAKYFKVRTDYLLGLED